MNTQKALTSIIFTLFLLMQAGAALAQTVFFGEDLAPLAGTPNSDAARDQFLANITGAGTEDFEGFTHGETAPLAIDFGAAGVATLTGTGQITNVVTLGRFPITSIPTPLSIPSSLFANVAAL